MAEETYFDKISAQIKTGTEPFQWYRNRIKELGTPNTAELLRSGKLSKQPTPKTPKYVYLFTERCKEVTLL